MWNVNIYTIIANKSISCWLLFFKNRMMEQITKNIKVKVFFILIPFLCACTKLVTDTFPDYHKLPTVNALCIAGEPLMVKLTYTGGIDSLPLASIDDAVITIQNDGQLLGVVLFMGDGVYSSDFPLDVGKEYTCRIKIADFDTIFCSQTIPSPNPILGLEPLSIAGRDEEGSIYHGFRMTIKNDLTKTCYYEVDISEGQLQHFNDPLILREGMPIPLFSNEGIKDSVFSITLNYRSNDIRINNGKRILNPYFVTLRSVTHDYYLYQKQLCSYLKGKYSDINTSISPITLYSNIDNAFGIIAGYSLYVSDTIYPLPYDYY
jgi:hypothetical protein